jgi:hypothetical protein
MITPLRRFTRSQGHLARNLIDLDLPIQVLFVLIALAFMIAMQTAHAQETSDEETVTTTTTTKTVKRKGSTAAPPSESSETGAGGKDFIVTAKFGSTATSGLAGCKTEALSKDVIKGLKSDCSAWLNDRKAELKNKFHTGTCQEQCSDCGMSLVRCTVTGEVHYSK